MMLREAILGTLREGSNYPKPSPLGMTFNELCKRTRPRRWERKWTTHKNAVSRAVWALAEREVPLVRIWALLLVPVYSRNHPIEVNSQWLAANSDFGTWFGGPRPRIKLVALTAAGSAEAERGDEQGYWRDIRG
jgi:hypothetical protein